MVNQIPRPLRGNEAKHREEERQRLAERRDGSRKSENTTIGRGGRIDVDGDLNFRNGGSGTIEKGGKFNVRGSMDITDDGEVTVTGQGPAWAYGDTVPVRACLGNRPSYDPWMGVTYTQPGLYFSKGESLGGLDPRVASEDGDEVQIESASELMQYGPQAGSNIKSSSSIAVRPWAVSMGAKSWDQSVNYEGRDGLNGLRANAYASFTTFDFTIGMENYEYQGVIPQGTIASIRASLEDRVLRLQGMDGVDIKGPFTVDGQPVGGAVTSVAGKTGAVSLVKGDVGLGNVDNTSDANKPVSNATQTALNGKAASTHGHNNATTTTPGFMSPTDKGKLDGATPSPTPNSTVYRDAWGRAQIADPVGADDIANKRAVDKKADASYTPSTQATIGAGFSHYNSSGWTGVRYTEKNGFVEITGAFAKGSWGPGEIIARLPQSMWPPAKKAGIKCEIGTTGEISTIVAGTGADSIGAMYIR